MKKALSIVAAVLSVAGLLGGCTSTAQRTGPDKVVYHINDSQNATAALRNIGNHLEVDPKAKIVVVTHAKGVDFLMNDAKDKNNNPYNVSVEALKAQGVIFDVCEITLRNRKLTKDLFIEEVAYVASGVAEIARLQQREGFAYLRP